MEQLGHLLLKYHLQICSAESFTVGSFGAQLGDIPGISRVYAGSIVSYQTRIKNELLHVDQDMIDTYGVVSEQVCEAMAVNAKKIFKTDIAVSFTGNSGPLPMENKPVGLCFVGICFFETVTVYPLHLEGTRLEIKEQAIAFAKQKLIEIISKEENKWQQNQKR